MLRTCLFASAALAGATAATALAGGADLPLATDQIVGGLAYPTTVAFAPGNDNLMYILQKQGRIRIFDFSTNSLLPNDFINLDGSAVVGGDSINSEQGLLGIAFHPDFASNGYFYVNYTGSGGTTIVRRYTATSPTTVNAASAQTVITIAQPFSNHNGGWMGFGPDGYLYISTGDGGSANDPGNRAQDITAQLLGKMLRIDVDGDDFPGSSLQNYAIPADNPFVGIVGDDEIWHYGLRNPWRCAFDPATGDLWIADVGQFAIEEVSFAPAGVGGLNFGWRCLEGNNCTGLTGCSCADPNLTAPIHTYGHNALGGNSISGGAVYRGCEVPEADGAYFFGDWTSAKLWSLRYDGVNVSDFAVQTGNLSPSIEGIPVNQIVGINQNNAGELFIVDHGGSTSGQIFKIVRDPNAEPLPDCNENGTPDTCDIASGGSSDENGNGIPDECEGPNPDLDGNGTVDGGDLGILLSAWGDCPAGTPCPADLDGNGTVDGGDLGILLAAWTV